jgi:hypothetical protein
MNLVLSFVVQDCVSVRLCGAGMITTSHIPTSTTTRAIPTATDSTSVWILRLLVGRRSHVGCVRGAALNNVSVSVSETVR